MCLTSGAGDAGASGASSTPYGLYAMLGSTALQALMDRGLLQSQGNVEKQDIATQQFYRDQAMKDIGGEIGKIGTDTPLPYDRTLGAQYAAAVKGGQPLAFPAATTINSPMYAARARSDRASVLADAGARSRALAASAAPFLQRLKEGFGISQTGANVGTANSFAKGTDAIDQLRLAAIRGNPMTEALLQALGAAGMAYQMRKLYAAPGTGMTSGDLQPIDTSGDAVIGPTIAPVQ